MRGFINNKPTIKIKHLIEISPMLNKILWDLICNILQIQPIFKLINGSIKIMIFKHCVIMYGISI